MHRLIAFYFLLTIISCNASPQNEFPDATQVADLLTADSIINKGGKDLQSRFNPPSGFLRQNADSNSFAYYLRHLPLKPVGSKVKYYNGQIKHKDVYSAVIDMNIGDKDLQQCADAIMRLRGEYFFSKKSFDKISFNLTNGFEVDYATWSKGYRVYVNQNKTSWQRNELPSSTYEGFLKYMDFIFAYAGTLSLDKTLKSRDLKNISIGDVFIVGGSPGHAVIVADVAVDKNGEKVFMLAQSYMPAQDIHILINPDDKNKSPWYSNKIPGSLITPEWTFKRTQLKTW